MSAPAEASIYYDPFNWEIDADPHPVWRRMREEAPMYWNERYQFWALSRFDDVWNAYHDTGTFSSSHGVLLDSLDQPVSFPHQCSARIQLRARFAAVRDRPWI